MEHYHGACTIIGAGHVTCASNKFFRKNNFYLLSTYYHNILTFSCGQVKRAGSPIPQAEETIGTFTQSALECAELHLLSCEKTCNAICLLRA